nr:hypothetical protein [Tanacetum cinerariifolium]
LFVLPVGHVFGGGVHVNDGAIDIRGDNPVADGFQGDLRTLLLHLQRNGKGMALLQQLVRAQQGKDDQADRRREVDHQQ